MRILLLVHGSVKKARGQASNRKKCVIFPCYKNLLLKFKNDLPVKIFHVRRTGLAIVSFQNVLNIGFKKQAACINVLRTQEKTRAKIFGKKTGYFLRGYAAGQYVSGLNH